MQPSIYPIKGQYLPDEDITLILDICDQTADKACVSLYSLGQKVQEFDKQIEQRKTNIIFPSFGGQFNGYGVKAHLYKDNDEVTVLYAAFDVSNPGRVIRYGFLSDFEQCDADETDVEKMAKYHINTVQFYDWAYHPDRLVSPEENYTDLMGKKNCKSVVKEKIKQCHDYGMRAVGYGAVYSAAEEYQMNYTDQSLYASKGKPLCFIEKFYIMNISRESKWHDHIIDQYQQTVCDMDFDGIHMDTYGFPKSAFDSEGKKIFLEDHYSELIEDTRTALSAKKDDACLIFNNVGGWPVEKTKYAPQECVYIEVWHPLDKYYHLKQLIMDGKQSGKPVVLAAYPAPFRTQPTQALESLLICCLAISLCGATQLFLGENDAVITQGYYADYIHLDSKQAKAIKTYQDFFVQYQQLLFDESLSDVSLTHIGWDNTEYACDAEYSVTAQEDKLWLLIRENKDTKMIGMVNLCGNDNVWNTGKNKPKQLLDVKFSIQILSRAAQVWYASPDENAGFAVELQYKIEQTDRGNVVQAVIPSILYGGILWIKEIY